MSVGNWVPELVHMAGGLNVFGEAGRRSGSLEMSDLAAADPDVVAVLDAHALLLG